MKFVPNTSSMAALKKHANEVALEHFGEQIAEDAQKAAPFVSGDLHDSIMLDKEDMSSGKVYIGSDLEYAAPVETGERGGEPWRKAGPANFLRDSLLKERH